jgi:AcrR family transcriptional regulator
MQEPVKRRYSSARRQEQAAINRRTILEAALELFTNRGYRETSVAEIARHARVSVDTLYAAVGRKPELLLAVHDLVLGEMELDQSSRPLVADERAYVKAIQAEPTAAGKLRLYADALGRLLPRVTPLSNALREAGSTDPACRRLSASIDERRAANMRRMARGLRETGELRDDVTDDDVADLLWSMNSPAYFSMLVERGWTGERYADLIADVWTRTLLAPRDDRSG